MRPRGRHTGRYAPSSPAPRSRAVREGFNETIGQCLHGHHNGERFIEPQVRTILAELGPGDELIVVDDGSRDRTLELVEAFADPSVRRLRRLRNARNIGAVAAFDRAIAAARNDVVFLADQDDECIPGRVDRMIAALRSTGAQVVSGNSDYVDMQGAPVDFPMRPLRAEDSTRHWRNILVVFRGQAPYYGCAMAFERSFARVICPSPRYVELHDLWIALAANLCRANVHVTEVTLRRRIHGGNASVVSRSLARKLWSRVSFALSLPHLTLRVLRDAPRRRAQRPEVCT